MTTVTVTGACRITPSGSVVSCVLAAAIAGAVLAGCGARSSPGTSSGAHSGAGDASGTARPTGTGKEATGRPVVCVIAIDGTRSYRFVHKAKQTAVSVIRGLPGSSMVFVRWITEDSESDGCAIVSAVLPPDPVRPKNPYARQLRSRYREVLTESRHARGQVAECVLRAASPQAARTDIWGVFASAVQRCANHPDRQPVVILLTDMMDDVGKKPSALHLADVAVRVLDFQVDGGAPGRKVWWTQHLTELGARSVEFAHLDEMMTVTP